MTETKSKMKIIYANQELPDSWSKSIFLAGPTPRDAGVRSWRTDAIKELLALDYDGVVFIPEDESGKYHHSYIDQVGWEERCLEASDCIVFWIPRELKTMPGFTTNIELGVWLDSGKAVVGFPENAPKTKYIKHYVEKLKVPNARTLRGTLEDALRFVGGGVERTGGARKVPLFIYNTKHFQDWYASQTRQGNRLDDAKLLWNYRVGAQRKFPLFWSIHVDVYVAAEDRNKSNEIIIARTDISSVLAYHRNGSNNIKDTLVCLVKEFRSPASTGDGFIWELPGGSSPNPNDDVFQVASEELKEETGLAVPKERFMQHRQVARRQIAGTLSTHGSHLFFVELTDEELKYLKNQKGKMHGNHITDSEQTFVEVVTVDQILNPYFALSKVDAKLGEGVSPLCDWSTMGMIFSVLGQR